MNTKTEPCAFRCEDYPKCNCGNQAKPLRAEEILRNTKNTMCDGVYSDCKLNPVAYIIAIQAMKDYHNQFAQSKETGGLDIETVSENIYGFLGEGYGFNGTKEQAIEKIKQLIYQFSIPEAKPNFNKG